MTTRFASRLLVAGIIAAMPITGTLQGCGGGNSGPSTPRPTNAFVGNYTGSYRVTTGPTTGETGVLVMSVSSDGTVQGTFTDAAGNPAVFKGTVNLTTGSFTISGGFTGTPVTGSASGQLISNGGVVSGTGTFALNNGASGTLSLRQR